MLGHFEGLIQVGLDERVCELLPVGSLEDELLECFLVIVFNSFTTFDLVNFETFLCLKVGVLDDKLACLKEVIEGHGAILLVLGITKLLAFLGKLLDDLFGWLGFLKFSLFL